MTSRIVFYGIAVLSNPQKVLSFICLGNLNIQTKDYSTKRANCKSQHISRRELWRPHH